MVFLVNFSQLQDRAIESFPSSIEESLQLGKKIILGVLAILIIWKYNVKFFTPVISVITEMSRSFIVNGSQSNAAFYESDALARIVIICSLSLFLLSRNEFKEVFRGPFASYSTSFFAIFLSLTIVNLPLFFEFTPATGMPLLIFGGTILLGYFLLFDDIEFLSSNISFDYNFLSQIINLRFRLIRVLLPLIIYFYVILNVPTVKLNLAYYFDYTLDSEGLVKSFSLILLLMTIFSFYLVSSESANEKTQERRTATLMFMASLPIFLFLSTRILYLLNNPDSVTRERWDLDWGFMDNKNPFEINAWPIEPIFGEDSRWRFLLAAAINSIRVTLVSIVFCTVLGIIIGVTRLSSNYLASGLATLYVEVFRNMPLAVLLFLISQQLGAGLPLMTDEANIFGWIYYSNQGIFIPKIDLIRGVLVLILVFCTNYYVSKLDDSIEGIKLKNRIWFFTFFVSLGLILSNLSLPIYDKPNLNIPGTWNVVDGSGFEITVEFLAMIMGLTLFTAAVVAEIVRGSIQALPRGQVEAAVSLGLSPYQRIKLVILPQALRSMIPLLNSQYMNIWKNSSLAIVVAYSDIFYVIFVTMNNVGKLIPLFLLLLVIYQLGSLSISALMNLYNSRITRVKI